MGEVAYQRRLGVMCDGRAKQIQRRRYKEPKGQWPLAKTLPVIPITATLSDDGRSRIGQYPFSARVRILLNRVKQTILRAC